MCFEYVSDMGEKRRRLLEVPPHRDFEHHKNPQQTEHAVQGMRQSLIEAKNL